jgi:prevent-host-death family protein
MSVQDRRTLIKTVPATQARIHFGEMLKRVYSGREHLIIEKDGLPVATLLSHADYEQYRRLLALQKLDALNRGVNQEIKKRGWTEEELFDSLDKAQQEVFEEKYGRALKARKQKAA